MKTEIYDKSAATVTTREAALHPDMGADFLSIAKELQHIDEQSIAYERDRLAAEMAKQPEVFIPRQFEQLAELYRLRSDRQTMYWSESIEEVTMFASRALDRSHLEEVYVIRDDFGPHNRNWQTRTYIARTKHGDEGSERLFVLDHNGILTVKERASSDSKWQQMDEHTTEQAMRDFFRESLRAVTEQLRRTPDEQQRADEDALRMLKVDYHIPAA